jgi:hypothetical protein
MVAFNPLEIDDDEFTYMSNATTKISTAVADYGTNGPDPFGYSTIFNLKDGNVFEFEVPYMSPRAYMNFISGFGTLAMYTVDTLQSSAVLASSIQVLVEVKATDDFEFSNVRTPWYPAHISATPQFQSGRVLSTTKADVSELTMGEVIASLKQLISIPKVTPLAAAAASTLQFFVPPWYYLPRYAVTLPAPTATLSESFSIPGIVAKAYAYVKGGTDLHIYADTNNNGHYSVVRQTAWKTTVDQVPGQQPFSNNPMVLQPEGTGHYRLPSYQQYVRFFSTYIDNAVGTGSSWGPAATKSPTMPTTYVGPNTLYRASVNFPSASTVFVSRAASDDAGAAAYLGPVPLLLLSTNTFTTLYDVDSVPTSY